MSTKNVNIGREDGKRGREKRRRMKRREEGRERGKEGITFAMNYARRSGTKALGASDVQL